MNILDFTAKLEDYGFTDIKVSEPLEDAPTDITFINTNETEFSMSVGTELAYSSFKPLGKRTRQFGHDKLEVFDFIKALTL